MYSGHAKGTERMKVGEGDLKLDDRRVNDCD